MFLGLSRLLRRGSFGAADAKQAILGARTAGVPTFRESLPRLALELRRARRYERPLAVLAVGPGNSIPERSGGHHGDNVLHLPPPIITTHMVFFLLGSLLRDSMRETDIITYAAEHHLYALLLPESGEAGARRAVDRISRLIYDRAEVRLRAGMAEFPRDALTVEDLFGVARKGWKGQVLVGHIPVVKEASHA